MWIYSKPKDATRLWAVHVVIFCESCLSSAGAIAEERLLTVRAMNAQGAKSMAINLLTRMAIDDELGIGDCTVCGQVRFTYVINRVTALELPTPRAPNPLKVRDDEPNPFIDFDKSDDQPEAPAKRGRRKGDPGTCSICGEKGHTKRTCPNWPVLQARGVAAGCPYPCSEGSPCVLCIQRGVKPDPSLWV